MKFTWGRGSSAGTKQLSRRLPPDRRPKGAIATDEAGEPSVTLRCCPVGEGARSSRRGGGRAPAIMAIPDYQTLMLPVLTLAAKGETRVPAVAEQIANDLGLSQMAQS